MVRCDCWATSFTIPSAVGRTDDESHQDTHPHTKMGNCISRKNNHNIFHANFSTGRFRFHYIFHFFCLFSFSFNNFSICFSIPVIFFTILRCPRYVPDERYAGSVVPVPSGGDNFPFRAAIECGNGTGREIWTEEKLSFDFPRSKQQFPVLLGRNMNINSILLRCHFICMTIGLFCKV